MLRDSDSSGCRPLILLVEDDDGSRAALSGWLAHDYEVATARDGIEGLERATGPTPPDLVITDVWMPRLDGVEMVRRLKQIPGLRGVPVIFLTGQTSAASVVAGISAGARAYLPKPVDLNLLDRKVRSALSGRPSAPPSGMPTP